MPDTDQNFALASADPTHPVPAGSTRCVDPAASLSNFSHLAAELAGSALADDPVPLDKRLTGERQAAEVLSWLHRFGWLTSRMIAALVWPTASQSWPLARRLLKKLLDDKLVLVRALPQGGDLYLLSVKGARLLTDTTGIAAKSGQSLPTGDAIHRACGTWYLIAQVQAGLDIWTEHEIASGRAPLQTLNGKQADGLVLHEGGQVTWLEVENAWKNRARRQAVVDLATRHLGRDRLSQVASDAQDELLYLARLVVVSTGIDALRSMASSFQEAHRLRIASESCLAQVDVSILPVSPSLVPGERTDGNLWWDVMHAGDARPHSQ